MKKLSITTENNNFGLDNVLKYRNATECYCGHCNNKIGLDVYLKIVDKTTDRDGRNVVVEKYHVGQCPVCGKPVIYDLEKKITLPNVRSFEDVKSLPDNVSALFNELRDAFSVGAYTSCVIAGRTLLAHIAVEEGAESHKKFEFYVDYLVDNFMSKNKSKPWVDKVRKLGNESTHDLVIATKEDAEASLTFLTFILKLIYEYPNAI